MEDVKFLLSLSIGVSISLFIVLAMINENIKRVIEILSREDKL